MQRIGGNDESRIWLCSSEESETIVGAHDAMLARLDEIGSRAAEAEKPLRDEHAAAEAELRARHEAEFAELRRAAAEKLVEGRRPFDAESQKASADFHAAIWGLNGLMTRNNLPMIALNQYALTGMLTIVERL